MEAPLHSITVGACEERWRHFEAERPGRLQVDDELSHPVSPQRGVR